MVSRKITIKNSQGLHAPRPVAFFIQKANAYKASIWVEKGDRRVNAKSLLGVLSLAVTQGMEITLLAEGPDAANAIAGLADLLENGLTD